MRIALILALSIAVVMTSYAQTLNPYDQFGYQPKKQYIMTKKTEGLLLLNENAAAGAKNLLINHKSKQIFVIDSQDSVLQVFNVPAEAVTRFISVDPLTKKYPELTPYQFASNTPIQAIDLDGLEAYYIHGTMSSNKRWVDKNGNDREVTNVLFQLTDNRTKNTDFNWGGFLNYGNGPFNTKTDRGKAAEKLVKHIMATMKTDEPITLIGHSHGGNVAIQAIPILREALDQSGLYDVKINLITIATPADNSLGSKENPFTNRFEMNSHMHLYNNIDAVQTTLANSMEKANYGPFANTFSRQYTNPITQNTEVNVDQYYKTPVTVPLYGEHGIKIGTETHIKTNGTGAHSFDYEHPEVIQKGINNGTIKKPKS
jgi:hypothetical protein